ncbi:MAG: hypothetical protein ACREQK_19065 [Candidatus Binatia bacterium]
MKIDEKSWHVVCQNVIERDVFPIAKSKKKGAINEASKNVFACRFSRRDLRRRCARPVTNLALACGKKLKRTDASR